MTSLLKRFWHDQSGGLISAELILVATILVVALVVGLASLRDAINTELGDFASAIANLDQSFSVSGISNPNAAAAGNNSSTCRTIATTSLRSRRG